MSSSPKSSNPSNDSKKAVSRRDSAKIKKYFQARREFPHYSKTKCLQIAGYTHNNAGTVEKTKQFQALWAEHEELVKSLDLSIEERIRAAQKATGAGVKRNMAVLAGIVNKKAAKDRDRIAATKQVTEITGEKMPTEISATLSGDEELLSAILTRHTT